MNTFIDHKLPVYVVNLEHRTDRREHILYEFKDRPEFSLNLIDAISHHIGAVGLWQTLQQIVQHALDNNFKFIIICEDDHQFTPEYTEETLLNCINEGYEKNADVICGGVSWFDTGFKVSTNLFWVERFSGLQFTIIYKSIFENILTTKYDDGVNADYKISELSDNKFFIFPYISIQKEFGYSDVTSLNNKPGRVEDLFLKSSEYANSMIRIPQVYSSRLNENIQSLNSLNIDNLKLTTYLFSFQDVTDQLKIVYEEFRSRNEFDLQLIRVTEVEDRSKRLWLTVQHAVEKALQNDESIVVICGDNHRFTQAYSKEHLFKNLLKAYFQGMSVLYGGTSYLNGVLPITENICWLKTCYSMQFVVLFKGVFQKILDESYQTNISPLRMLSELTSNKAIIYPFVSEPSEQHNVLNADYCIDEDMKLTFSYKKALVRIENAYERFHESITDPTNSNNNS